MKNVTGRITGDQWTRWSGEREAEKPHKPLRKISHLVKPENGGGDSGTRDKELGSNWSEVTTDGKTFGMLDK